MYTRSRSSGGGPGFGNGRGQMMNSGNGNSFQGQNPYNNQQGGNYMQTNFKPGGMIHPSAPFKPSGGPSSQHQQQGMQARQQQQQQQQNPKPLQQQQQQQPNQSQAVSTPVTPRLKPILKQTASPAVASIPATPTTGNVQTTATPSPVPAPTSTPTSTPASTAPAKAPSTPIAQAATIKTPDPAVTPVAQSVKVDAIPAESNVAATDEAAKKNSDVTNEQTGVETMDNDDPRRWAEDDQGKWTEIDEQGGQWMDTEDGPQERPKWRRFKKLAGNKPNKKLKRLRMNQRLRKALMPKNAIMVLNEMKAGVQFTFPETQAIMPNSLFLVHAELEGKVYVGQGLSKPLARQNAAENALKCLLLEKMTAAAMKDRVDSEGDTAMETQPDGESTPATTTSTTTTAATPGKEGENGEENAEDNDDVPWSSLASFALYKLFLEWQNQGTVVPIPRPGVPAPTKNRVEPKPTGEKQLPPNASEIHPVMLLNQMRPGTTYTEVGRVGTPPNIQFTLGVDVNGTTYTGSAKNKKDAKKLAAKEALKALYNLDYPEEMKTDNPDISQ